MEVRLDQVEITAFSPLTHQKKVVNDALGLLLWDDVEGWEGETPVPPISHPDLGGGAKLRMSCVSECHGVS